MIVENGRVARIRRPVDVLATRDWASDFRIALPALAIGGAIVAGMGWNIAPLTTLGAVSAIVAAVAAPAVGLATIAFMAPLAPPLIIPAPGFNAALVGAVVLGCVYRLPIDRARIRLAPATLLLIGFVLYVGVQQMPEMVAGYAGSLGYLVYSDFRELLTGFGTVLAATYVLTRRSPVPFLVVGLTSASLTAVLAIVTSSTSVVGPPVSGLIAQSGVDRAIGSFGNPNYFGTFEAIAVVIAVSLMLGTRSARIRLTLALSSAVLTTGLVLSLSRGGVVALAAGLTCLAFSRSRARTAMTIAAGFLVAVVLLYPIFIQWRLAVTAGSTSAAAYALQAQSDEGRLAALLAGPQLYLTSPLFGIGFGHYSTMSAQFAGPGFSLVAHNWYMSVMAEEGTVGIVIWMLLLVAIVIALRSRPRLPRSIGLGVLGAYAVGSLFLEAPTSFQTSAIPILVTVAALVGDWTAPPAAEGQATGALRAPLGA